MPAAQVTHVKQARASADELEKALAGHLFLGGAKPAKEDVDKFYEMFGANNIAFYRWVRNMASFTELERKSWGLPETQ
ncbi:25 Kd elongation factor 1-beta, putative [Leishmania tarentolae]|uniref:25 Kd elongation factor 1-beta, putative n=1 Tax=Leishmania tarentolae TaxID=5689 RepID=A0A640KX83_LEITA|nr:25 Kd elongation factor 1-beta, putative [Leishmania tarentolae]